MLEAQTNNTPAPPPPPPAIEYNIVNWKEFNSTEGRFRILMPGVPTFNEIPVAGQLVARQYTLRTNTAEYGISYTDLPVNVEGAEMTKRFFDGGRNEVVANGATLLNENDLTLDGIVGREFIVEVKGTIGRNRMFLVNGRFYSLTLATSPNVVFKNGKPSPNPKERTDFYEDIATRFFDSFKFTSALK